MGTVRAIKQSELAGNTGNDYIYPVTSTKAVFDENNKTLEEIILNINEGSQSIMYAVEKIDSSLKDVEGFVSEQQDTNRTVSASIRNVETSISAVAQSVQNLPQSASYIKGSITPSNTRASSSQSNNIECFSPVTQDTTTGICQIFDDNNFKDGDILIPKKAGSYIIGDTTLNITELSLIQKQKNTYVLLSLGIPLPTTEDAGKSLKASSDGTMYWGE